LLAYSTLKRSSKEAKVRDRRGETNSSMRLKFLVVVWSVLAVTLCARAQESNSCASLMNFKSSNIQITHTAPIPAGGEPNPFKPSDGVTVLLKYRMW
jgi:hypothetical protein